MTLQGSKEDLQFIRILPHPSNHFTFLFSVLVPFSYLRVWGVLHHAETWERHLLGGDFCLVFMAPTWWTVVSSPRSGAQIILFSSPHKIQLSCSSFAVKQSMSVHIALYQLEIWSSVLTDEGGSCCGVFVNLVGLKGHVVRKLLHSYSFSIFFFSTALKSPAAFHEQRRSLERARVRCNMLFEVLGKSGGVCLVFWASCSCWCDAEGSPSCSGCNTMLRRHGCIGWAVLQPLCGGGYPSVN